MSGDIARGLDRAYAAADSETIDLATARVVIFSDHHRGARDGADDFRRCEPAYNAALAYYFRQGHRLFLLGDVEELWECSAKEVLPAYGRTLALERRFHDAGRCLRFFGNHDDLWESKWAVWRRLSPLLPGVRVREALKLDVVDGDRRLGRLFLAHGHQGTAGFRWRFVSHPVLRLIWRPFQRALNIASTTPAQDWALRERHETAMFEWARAHPDRIALIAGHTHRPVFWTRVPEVDYATQIAELEQRVERDHEPALEAELEYLVGEQHRRAGLARPFPEPCYFNTGCCSFGDGDVTGIEIVDGEIRLVRWPDREGRPLPWVLQSMRLAEALRAVAPTGLTLAPGRAP
jgi:UDP-2,3-diacylglucosamine pyrophosphatase LpxH